MIVIHSLTQFGCLAITNSYCLLQLCTGIQASDLFFASMAETTHIRHHLNIKLAYLPHTSN